MSILFVNGKIKGNWHLLRALQVVEVGSHPMLLVSKLGITIGQVAKIVDMIGKFGITAVGMRHPKRGTKALAEYYLQNRIIGILEDAEMLVEVVPPSKNELKDRHGWGEEELDVELRKARLTAAEVEPPDVLADGAVWLLKKINERTTGLWIPLDEQDQDKIIDIARSIATLSGHGQIEISDMAEAIQYSVITYVESSLAAKVDLIEPVRIAMEVGPRHTITLENWEDR